MVSGPSLLLFPFFVSFFSFFASEASIFLWHLTPTAAVHLFQKYAHKSTMDFSVPYFYLLKIVMEAEKSNIKMAASGVGLCVSSEQGQKSCMSYYLYFILELHYK